MVDAQELAHVVYAAARLGLVELHLARTKGDFFLDACAEKLGI
jgi:hypothetical protein